MKISIKLFSVAIVLFILVVTSCSQSSSSSKTVRSSIKGNDRLESVRKDDNCATKPIVSLPVDIGLVESVLYPGQIRGGNYKPHGGFRFNTPDNRVEVKLPLDASLIDGSRYYEHGELQYLLDFETACKFRLRFDHLKQLSSELKKEAEKLPEAKKDDSRTTNLSGTKYKKGTVIATEVGFSQDHNVTVDFGLYDMNQKNKISSNSQWSSDFEHKSDAAQHGLCWFDYLDPSDKENILKLPGGDQASGKVSDYCESR